MMFGNKFRPAHSCLRFAALFVAAGWLAGCAALPTSGPAGNQIRAQVTRDAAELGMTLVQVETINDLPRAAEPAGPFQPDYTPPVPTELVGPGDVLNITVFESGISLFNPPGVSAPGGGFDTAANSRQLPPMRVSDEGTISFPFVGEVHVRGRTTREVQTLLRQALQRKSQNPQVLVSIAEGLTNSVIIGGDVVQPGRLVLPTNRESLSEVLALAGGARGEIRDLIVRVARGDTVQQWRLSDIMNDPSQDIRIFPADRISLVTQPQTFSVLGAAGQANQFPFPDAKASLIEALALAGGADPRSGNARAIFIFRVDRDEAGNERPYVYHFNMMNASAFVLAQRFALKDKDVIYVGNAQANQASKLVSVLSQLFFPLVALQQAGAL